MALISTLRTKMTKWVVGAIALSMGAFIVGSDLLGGGNNSIFGNNNSEIGSISGRSISIDEYNFSLQKQERNYYLSNNRRAGEGEKLYLQNQAWSSLINQDIYGEQYEKLGLEVTNEELQDMIYGKNVEPGVKTNFTDSLGNFDREKLINYLKSLETVPKNSEAYIRWEVFQSELRPSRRKLKYENLFSKASYVTDAEVEFDFHNNNDVADFKFLFIPYFTVNDSLIELDDNDYRKYYKKNNYNTDHTRSLSYVTFSIVPSKDDSLAFQEEIKTIANDFKTIDNDSIFAVSQTEGVNPVANYSVSSLPKILTDQIENLQLDSVIGPLFDDESYKLFKVLSIVEDDVVNAKANHILIKWDGETREEKNVARRKAQKILNRIKNGESFSKMASEFGSDGTASNGGDLGWFKSGQMVKPFETAVFNSKKLGLLPSLVETKFGYHIIEVTGLKNNNSYTIATIERSVAPSDETLNGVFREADTFKGNISSIEEFSEKAKEAKLQIVEAEDIGTNDRKVNSLADARQLVIWLFRDAEVGTISEVLSIDDNYVVAVMTDETKSGTKPYEKVKSEIEPIVQNEAKGKYIINKLKGDSLSLEDMKALFDPDATINTKTGLKINGGSIVGVGSDPDVIGAVFSLEKGERSKPIAGQSGVTIIELTNLTIMPLPEDNETLKSKLLKSKENSKYNIVEALKEAAKVEDFRYKFF